MKSYVLAVESTDDSRTYGDLEKRLSKAIESRPCHVLDSLWCIKSDVSLKDIYDILSNKLVHPDDKFVLAPIADDWLVHNAKSNDDCFDLNE